MKKTLQFIITGALLLLPIAAHADFNKAAAEYENKAKAASKAGHHDQARIYERMADIKRTAAAGKLKNWDEYHKLAGKLKELQKGGKCADGKCDDDKKGIVRKKNLSNDDFFAQAKARREAAANAEKKRAAIIAAIDEQKERAILLKTVERNEALREAAANAERKRAMIDREKALREAAGKSKYEAQAKHHMVQADKAMQSGDERSARIYTQMAQFLVKASILDRKGEKVDLAPYFQMQQELFAKEDKVQ